MGYLIIEWNPPSLALLDELLAKLQFSSGGTALLRHYYARSESRAVSIFRGDISAVEASLARSDLPRIGPWEAELIGDELPGPAADPFVTIVLQRTHNTPTDRQDQQSRRRRAAECLELYKITPRGSYLAIDGRRQICIFEAPDAESVRMFSDANGEAFDLAWNAAIIDG